MATTLVEGTLRLCARCRVWKSEDLFGPYQWTNTPGSRRCTECTRTYAETLRRRKGIPKKKSLKGLSAEEHREYRLAQQREYAAKNPRQAQEIHLRNTYGLMVEDYDRLLEDQNGVCAICGKEETCKKKADGGAARLHVDHDHATGEVRALLCHRCNMALGFLQEAPEIARKMVDYIDKWTAKSYA